MNALSSFTIGVDLGGTNMRIAAVNHTGQILRLDVLATEVHRGRDRVISEMAAIIRDQAQQFTPGQTLLGIGVGIPGIIDLAAGTLRSAANLPGWNDYPVKGDLEERLGVPVMLENDANCAALGEQWIGAGRGVQDLCMVTLGTGVGGGFVVNGRPWHGMTGMAGEIGHMTVIPEGLPCPCGNRGCLEQYASGTAITRMARESIAQGRAPALAAAAAAMNSHFGARTVFEAAQGGDQVAAEIFATAGTALGIALANLINALNLPLYVVGGGVAKAWTALRPAVLGELSKRSIVFRASEPLKSRNRTTLIASTELEENAGLLGAARLPMLSADPSAYCSLAG
jgi:glucokinase